MIGVVWRRVRDGLLISFVSWGGKLVEEMVVGVLARQPRQIDPVLGAFRPNEMGRV